MIAIKSTCTACGGHIEHAEDLSGEDITCPHCQQLTRLGRVIQPPPIPTLPSQPKTVEQEAADQLAVLGWVKRKIYRKKLQQLGVCTVCGHFGPNTKGCAICNNQAIVPPYSPRGREILTHYNSTLPKITVTGSDIIVFWAKPFAIIAMVSICILPFFLINSADLATSTPAPAHVEKTVSAGISRSSYELRITNNGTEDWNGVDCYINGQPPFSYAYHGLTLKAGGTRTMDLTHFTKRDGERFQPSRYQVTEVWIGGAGFDYAQFSF